MLKVVKASCTEFAECSFWSLPTVIEGTCTRRHCKVTRFSWWWQDDEDDFFPGIDDDEEYARFLASISALDEQPKEQERAGAGEGDDDEDEDEDDHDFVAEEEPDEEDEDAQVKRLGGYCVGLL